MISKEQLGKRIREVRQRADLTLKEVERLSGLSSTHISEIERGMTSPTIGALIRIAHALQKDPSFFVEERKLDEVCVTTPGDRPRDARAIECEANGGSVEPLTRGVLGGRICVQEIAIEPGGSVELKSVRTGQDCCLYCAEGSFRLRSGTQEMRLMAGDSVHGQAPGRIELTAEPGGEGRLILISDPGADCR